MPSPLIFANENHKTNCLIEVIYILWKYLMFVTCLNHAIYDYGDHFCKSDVLVRNVKFRPKFT